MYIRAKTVLMITLLATLWFDGNFVFAAGFDQEHSVWNGLLKNYVVDHGTYSEVRYRQIKQSASNTLNEYLQSLSAVSKSQFDGWSQAQRLAFLINAYNAFTVKLIVDHYPVNSIKDLGGFFTSPWKIEFFTLFGEKTYLDHVEHDLIRGQDYHEPRIHFALVCASVGCPKLQNRAYTAQRLETMLESASETFLRDTTRNRYDAADNTLYLSSIFKWYGKDFAAKAGSVKQFVAQYISDDPKIQQRIRSRDVNVEYLDYDWSLNDADAH